MNFLRSIFAPSVASLTSSLQRTVARLEAHAERQDAAFESIENTIVSLEAKQAAAGIEAHKARQVARKISGLLA